MAGRPDVFGNEFRKVDPEARRLLWEMRARGGHVLLPRNASRDHLERLGAYLRDRRLVRFAGGGPNTRLELTDCGNAYLDRLMRCE